MSSVKDVFKSSFQLMAQQSDNGNHFSIKHSMTTIDLIINFYIVIIYFQL